MSDPGRKQTLGQSRIPVTPVPRAGQGMYGTQGMISSINEFVDSAGNLTPVSFRFLYSLYSEIQALKASIGAAAIEALTNAVGQQFNVGWQTNAPAMPSVAGATFTGVGGYFTPKSSRVLITIDAAMYNTNAGGTSIGFIIWGPGTFPGTGAPYLGPPSQNPVGQYTRLTEPVAGAAIPFTQSAVLGNLTPNQQYWTDFAIAAGSGGASISDIEMQVLGLIDPIT